MMNLLEEAIVYSTIMYQGKVRKIKNTPFILHPLEVAQILSTMTDDFEIIAAGVLHDVVEDTDGTLGEIRKRFGERVAMLVDSETESEFPDESKADSWFKRKEYALEKLRNSTDIGVKMLWLADKLSNLRSLARSYGEVGEKLWENLHQKDPAMQLRYYKAIAEHTEMDLNKTGVYKEYIDRINYIWPGTFDSSKAKYKKYREVSVDHCERIGKGAKSDVYRYDDELIIKVYNSKNTYKDVEQEIGMTRTAFVMGLPTAISFGIVAVGSRYGAMFELIDAKTISELIAKNPEHIEYYAGVMADLALQIHGTEQEDEALFPDASAQLQGWVERAFIDEDEALASRIMELVQAIPPTTHLVHGDFHTGNVFLSNGEPMFIDVDRMSAGNAILDVSSVYLFYVGYSDLDPAKIEDFMGFSSETARQFYHVFIRRYLQTDDEALIDSVTRKAALLASVRLIGQLKKHGALSEKDRSAVDSLLQKIRDLSATVDSLAI